MDIKGNSHKRILWSYCVSAERGSRSWLLACCVVLLTGLSQVAAAEGVFCYRDDDGVCTPMDTISSPLWSLSDGGSWSVFQPWTILQPKPVFSSVKALLQFYVAQNADLNKCGSSPQLVQSQIVSFGYTSSPKGLLTNDLRYTDPVNVEAYPAAAEEILQYYHWTVLNHAGPTPYCEQTTIGVARRSVGVCPSGFRVHIDSIPGPILTWPDSTIIHDPDICFQRIYFHPKNLGDCVGPNESCGNPIAPATGNKFQREVDIPPGVSGALGLERYYNSTALGFQDLGPQWRHSYDRSIVVERETALHRVWAQRQDGKGLAFTTPAAGLQWTGDPDVADQLYQTVDAGGNPSGWRYVTAADDVELYDVSGRLLSITSRTGLTQTLSYSDASTPNVPKAGLLLQVVDSYGRHVGFSYDAQARIARVVDALGQAYQYSYDTTGMLASVAYPDAHNRDYVYNEAAYTQNTFQPRALTGIIDENRIRFATFAYDSSGRGVSTEHSGGVDRYALSYQVIGSYPQTVVTDPLGAQRTYSYSSLYGPYTGAFRNTMLTQPCVGCGNVSELRTYDVNGNVSTKTDFNAHTTLYQYDLARNLETLRSEAYGLPQQRTILTQWHPTYRLPVQITEPAPGGTKTTAFTYDASGNLTQKLITAPRNDGTNATVTRNFIWTYVSLGRIATSTDPNGNVTTYAYYADNDPDMGKRGNVQTITNAVGQLTQFTSFDAAGRPLSISDANGLATALAYDARGRITLRQMGAELIRYVYDGVGQLTRVTLPDGSYLQYAYDGAHRLTQVSDSLGNKIVYTLDAIGNRIGESAYDPAGQLARTRARQFDALNRLALDLGAQGQTTAYTYDNNGNRLTTVDPLGHSTGNVYDALNRLTQALDPSLGVTKYAYDNANNLTQVTDPRNLATTYKHDGLNNLVQQVSPDTGTTTNSYDSAGNLLTRTDARAVTATYTYDSINRATRIVFSNGSTSETQTFQYDIGSNAKGRLNQVTDTSGFTNWTYNSQGRVTSKAQTVDAYTKTVSYGYNSAGQLTSITTPSGQQVGYGYLNNRITSVTINGQAVVQGAATTPFGPITAWRWGNGLYTFRDYDRDGRLATWEFRNGASILRKDHLFDAASRIISITDPVHAASNQTYQYDALDRLAVAQTGVPPIHTQQFSYDPVGNRLNVTLDSSVTNFAYGSANNRLQTLSGALPANYLLGSGSWSFTYNNANRLSTVQSGATTIATYRVNALGQRVSKNAGGPITYFVYDERGHLLGEYDAAGSLIQETVWLEDLAVATLRPTGAVGTPTPINVFYVHDDHLGSPRAVTRPSDNAIMWQWDNQDPFGTNLANENPAGQGTFKYALRFPGQYYDVETGTHYNYYRDFDPTIGRYVQSDPIGLLGGIDTYGYVAANPLAFEDAVALAYFAHRPLKGAPWLWKMSCNAVDEYFGTAVSHEQLFFEDGKSPSNIGFFEDGTLKEEPNPTGYRCNSGHYDDCIMRKVVARTPPLPRYCIIGSNCQTWAGHVRTEYARLAADAQVKKDCEVCQ